MTVKNLNEGSLFDTEADAIVNTVNCVGVMGKGLALEFKKRFPGNNDSYAAACRRGELVPGGLHVVDLGPDRQPGQARWIVNLATKDHWRDPSKLEWVVRGVELLSKWAAEHDVRSIACPALGSGLGGLPWEDVRRACETAFGGSPVELKLFAPQGPTPAAKPAWRPR